MESDDAIREALRPFSHRGVRIAERLGANPASGLGGPRKPRPRLEAVKDFIERHDGRVDEPPVYQSRAMGSGQWGGKHRFPPSFLVTREALDE